MVKTALPSGKVVMIDKAKLPQQSNQEMKHVSQTTLEVVRPKRPQSEAQKANTLRLVALAKQRALERRGITEIDQDNIPSKDQIPEDKELVYIKTKKASTRNAQSPKGDIAYGKDIEVPKTPKAPIHKEDPFPQQLPLERQNGYYNNYNNNHQYYPQQYRLRSEPEGLYYPYQNERAVQQFYMPQPPQYIPVPFVQEKTGKKPKVKKSKTYYDTSEADTEEQETEPDTDYEIERLQKKIEKKASVVEKLNKIQPQPYNNNKLKTSGVF